MNKLPVKISPPRPITISKNNTVNTGCENQLRTLSYAKKANKPQNHLGTLYNVLSPYFLKYASVKISLLLTFN